MVDQLLNAKIAQVPVLVKQMEGYRRWVDPALKKALDNSSEGSGEKLHASLALLPTDGGQRVEYLYQRLLTAKAEEVPVLRASLKDHSKSILPKLWSVVTASRLGDDRLLPAASALALYDPGNPRWEEFSPKVSQAMVAVNPASVSTWIEALRPVRQTLMPPLTVIFKDKESPAVERSLARSILSDYVKDRPGELANLLLDAEAKAFTDLFPLAETQAGEVVTLFLAEITRNPGETSNEAAKDRLAERQARAAVALVRMGKAEAVWPLLKHSSDPRLRSFIVNWLDPLGADPKSVVAGIDGIDARAAPGPAEGPRKMDAILFHPETSMRRALILALGTYGREGLTAGEREPLTGKLLDLYVNDPDPGIHGSAEWTLRQWKQGEKLKAVDSGLMKRSEWDDRRWFVNGEGQTFAVIDGPVEFVMGSSPDDPDHRPDEKVHPVRIPRRFAIATKEVSKEYWKSFLERYPEWEIASNEVKKYSPDPDGPMLGFSWYIAAAYCNWLSEREGLAEDQWCYVPARGGKYTAGMTIPADVLGRKGYRLPTEAEWEYACRSGTETSRYYGFTTGLLERYARYQDNSKSHAWPGGSVLPNDLGLFDMLGNGFEWCQDRYRPYERETKKLEDDNINIIEEINEDPRLLRGGSFDIHQFGVRSAFRNSYPPSTRFLNFGFRPCRTSP